MSFVIDSKAFPKAGNTEKARQGVEQWLETADGAESGLATFARDLAADSGGLALLHAVFGNSPYLSQILMREMAFVRALLAAGPDAAFATLLADLNAELAELSDDARLMRALRLTKRRAALLIALADIGGWWPLEKVTGALSLLAETCLDGAARHLLRRGHASGAFRIPNPNAPEQGSGYIVLGMGKLGAFELNYSSDIDLVVLYDPQAITADEPYALQQALVRLTRNLVRFIDERGKDGYVFRTDLRLRPDPGSMPLAISVNAAEAYYESTGQNWERAAMIKARPVAGDRAAGAEFMRGLRPFLWRKHLDFAAIQDIHSIKRQINAHRGGHAIAVAGHNVKLGRGGIREIEFFAQTQQLIWGGRDPSLRVAPTCEALHALAAAGHVSLATVERLIESYRFLRRVEHRLQMIDDHQTHTLPTDEAGLEAVAVFLGYSGLAAFQEELLTHLRRVEEHYGELFEESPPLTGPGNLVFTGAEDDPETVRTIESLGFSNGSGISAIIRAWHHGRYRAMRSARARELMTELMPALLTALAKTADPDGAFHAFDTFLSRLPAGVQLLSLFYNKPELLDLIAEIMGSAPRLAAYLSRNPRLLDAVLSSDFFEHPPAADEMALDLGKALGQAVDYQDVLDTLRRWANDRRFQIGVQVLRGILPMEAAGVALSDVADTCIAALQTAVETEFAATHGVLPGGGMSVVAMGKLGGREMTARSDLDLIFVYDVPAETEMSNGPKPLAPMHYYARLSQRLINGLTAPTAEGSLYEVDMRLRPSGNAGPLACSLESFERYERQDAWTWEHMALTRARVISGPPALRQQVRVKIAAALQTPCDPSTLRNDIADMRQRIDKERHTDDIWKVKYIRGGLIDIEFIAQYLQLLHVPAHPEVVSPNTLMALDNLAKLHLLERSVASELMPAAKLWSALQGLLRMTMDDDLVEDKAPPGLRGALATAVGAANFTELKAMMRAAAECVHRHFQAIVGEPSPKEPLS